MLVPAAVLVGGLAFLASNAGANMPPPAITNPPRTVIIAIDLSASNPLIRDPGFAAKVAERIKPFISNLAPRSKVMLRSFGAYNSNANAPLFLDITIAPKTARAEDIAKLVSGVVAGVPQMVQQGDRKSVV